MEIKPIRSERDANAARRHLAELIRANDSGANNDSIEVWATLIEQFERAHLRLNPPSPVGAIKFRMQERGVTARQLEPYIGTRARVSEVLSGKRSLSIEMMRSLHQGLGIPYESLMSERSAPPREISDSAINLLQDFGFDSHQEAISSFLESSLSGVTGPALHRRSRTYRTTSKTDPRALMLWQAAVLKKAETTRRNSAFDSSQLTKDFLRQLAYLSPRPNGPELAVEAVRSLGVIVVFLAQLPSTFLDGAVLLSRQGNPVIALTLRHDRVDSFWFTLMHELSHVHLHLDDLRSGEAAFVDDMELPSEDRRETEADDLARKSLVPSSIIRQIRWEPTSTTDDLIKLATRSRVHVSIVAGRWQREFQNYRKFSRLIERGTLRDRFV